MHLHTHSHDHEGSGNNHHTSATKFIVSLKDEQEVANGTKAFFFEKPAGFTYRPGQHSEWTLINPPETDAEGNSRMFSLASAPSERNLMIATRMRDTAYKRVLGRMRVGDTLEVANPHGSFTLHNDVSKPAVFLIGGIGITPVFSIIKDAAEKKLPHRIFLFYSNRRAEDAAFLNEFVELSKKNTNFTFVPTMTEAGKSKKAWDGETGYITTALIKKYLNNLQSAIYYLSGPESLVSAMRKLLNEAEINDDYIKTEEFSGY